MGSKETVKIGTRKSRLAMAQALQVRDALSAAYPDLIIELVPITTTGDRLSEIQLTDVEGKGIFLKELEDALLNNEIDCAVHSMKDVPVELLPELTIAVMLEREDPHDGLVAARSLAELPAGSRIGTGSSRRISQLRSFRPDLKCEQARGNVDMRVRKWQEGSTTVLFWQWPGLKESGCRIWLPRYCHLT
jgi:hydroxymethylbilane synthase